MKKVISILKNIAAEPQEIIQELEQIDSQPKHGGRGHTRKPKYTAETLINQLKELAAKLGHSPRLEDLKLARTEKEYASSEPFIKRFGSWGNAQTVAGLNQTRQGAKGKSHEPAFSELKALYENAKQPLSAKIIRQAHKQKLCVSYQRLTQIFGSAKNACREANIPYLGRERTYRHWSEEEVIAQIQILAAKLGYQPTAKDIKSATRSNECPAHQTITRLFGTINKAFAAADISNLPTLKDILKAKAISDLKRLYQNLGHTPTFAEIALARSKRGCTAPSAYANYFGSLNKALVVAKIPVVRIAPERKKPRCARYTTEELTNQILALTKHLGKPPTTTDLRLLTLKLNYATFATFKKRFGSWQGALEAAGLKSEPHRERTKEAVIQTIRELKSRLGHYPTIRDWELERQKNNTISSGQTITRLFGSWTKALIAAGAPRTRLNKRGEKYSPAEVLDCL